MTLAAPVDAMADIVRACSDLGCVHIEDYTQFEEGIGIGRAIQSEDADKVSAMLVKVRAIRSAVSVFNSKGSVSASSAQSTAVKFEAELDKALGYLEAIREAEAEIATLEEQARIFETLASSRWRYSSTMTSSEPFFSAHASRSFWLDSIDAVAFSIPLRASDARLPGFPSPDGS